MKTFLRTSLVWIIVILGAWVYMTNFQEDRLYDFLNLNNPHQQTTSEFTTKLDAIYSGQIEWFETLKEYIDEQIENLIDNMFVEVELADGNHTVNSWRDARNSTTETSSDDVELTLPQNGTGTTSR